MKVSYGMNQTVKLLDPQLLDKPAQELWFLDGVILNVVCQALLIRKVMVGSKLGLAVQFPHLARLYRSRQ